MIHRFKDWSTKRKLALIINTVSGAVLLLACAAFYAQEIFTFRRVSVETVSSLSEVVGANSAAALLFGDRAAAEETLSALAARESIVAATIFKPDGTPFADYRRGNTSWSWMADETRADAPLDRVRNDHLVVAQPITDKGDVIGFVGICSTLREHRSRLAQYAHITVVILLLSLTVGAALSLPLQRIFLEPIAKLTEVSRSIATRQDYSARVPGSGRGDELGTLVRCFNLMLERIETSDKEIQGARDTLEQRVEERTSELVQEVAERRQIEEHLQIEKEMAQKYLDVAAVMFVALDSAGRVVLINRKGCEITGYEEDKLVGNNWFDLTIPESQRPQVKEVFHELMAGNASAVDSYQNKILTKCGKERLIAWSNTLLRDGGGRITGTLSSGEDITENQRMQEEILRTQKLESIGTFAGGIAHDFNNFLMAIQGYAELAKDTMNGNERGRKMLLEAEKAAKRARALTRQLITFAKGGEPVMRNVPIRDVVRDAASFVLTGSRMSPQFEIEDDLWLVKADTGQVEQVVGNLVINAKHAMPEGGTVWISLRNVDTEEAELKGYGRKKHVELCVRDEGIGIPSDMLPRIFDPYFTTKQEGSGLGLATIHSIVKKHEGHISVDSTPGAGSSFCVYLPASNGTSKTVEEKRETTATPLACKVLLMDDDRAVAGLLGAMLEKLGCCPTVTHDGRETVSEYNKARQDGEPYDAVILDVIVPGGMGGKETAGQLLQLDANARLIVSSGYSSDPLMARYQDYGFRACLPKPYTQSELGGALQKTVRA